MNVVSERQLLKDHNLAAKKWLGQNLLINKGYLNRIVLASHIHPGEHIVEIGAGLGSLTEALLNAGAHVTAIEIDAGFFRVLEEKFQSQSCVEIIHGDALKYDFRSLARRLGRLRVVANLPYSVSSRLLFRFVELRDVIQSAHVLLQREVARRLVADVGAKDYGILTVLLGITAQVNAAFDIPPAAFFPAPAVYSTFVSIAFPDAPIYPIPDSSLLVRLVKHAFRSRRKTLRNNLADADVLGCSTDVIKRAAHACSIDLGRRAETLSPEEFAHFAQQIALARTPS
jgi:16S rRNA (adenine1518-N6/adenine1519-N6)-dimethyltransferase